MLRMGKVTEHRTEEVLKKAGLSLAQRVSDWRSRRAVKTLLNLMGAVDLCWCKLTPGRNSFLPGVHHEGR
jgi:hypothetical protein